VTRISLSVRRNALALSVLAAIAAMASIPVACSSSGNALPPAGPMDSGAGTPDAPATASPSLPEVPCTDSIASIYADPGDVSAQPKGAILKCAHDADLTAAELLTAAQTDAGLVPYVGRGFTSGAHVYRVLYRTERGDPAGTPGYSSGLVLLPDTPRATQLPVLVVSHLSFGQGPKCAASVRDPASSYVYAAFLQLLYPYVGLGYAVIAPDLAGYANYEGAKNPPSAYAEVEDVGKSTLDGARALRKIIPHGLTPQIVLVGHSQGGQTTISAMSLFDSYGADGQLAAAAVFAPLWWSQRSFVALFDLPSNYAFDASAGGAVSIWIHYTTAELLDGQGHGVDLFKPDAQAGIKSFVDNDCWAASWPDLYKLGNSANDVFDPTYVQSMGTAALAGSCQPGDTRCATWLARLTADYPHLTGTAVTTPLLVWYANNDQTITPDLAACTFDRLSADHANYNVCYDSDPIGHAGILGAHSGYVADWIAAKTLGGQAPAACPGLSENDAGVPKIPMNDGGFWACNPLIPMQ
jgi:pimeloyl-ACP methyl ester carboxylesterase